MAVVAVVAVAIMAVIIVNTAFALMQEMQAERAVEALGVGVFVEDAEHRLHPLDVHPQVPGEEPIHVSGSGGVDAVAHTGDLLLGQGQEGAQLQGAYHGRGRRAADASACN
ncbi:hypothetical protein [Streptomyces sp. NPDC058092]|uniref:hypothetical protein n=1 Tax=Streptomyces sp. NPDC058092 TaxID=3346336 RepID=UPI0036EE364F